MLISRSRLRASRGWLRPRVDRRADREAVECRVFGLVVLRLAFHAAEHVEPLMRYLIPHEGPQDRGDLVQSQVLALIVGDEAHGVGRDVPRSVLGIADLHGLPLERLQVDLDEVVEGGAKLADAAEAEELPVDEEGGEVAARLQQALWLVPHVLELDFVLMRVELDYLV